jgi:hypothetical protein
MSQKYYAIFSKKDNFLHGAFPFTKDGLKLAKNYLYKISGKNKKNFYIKKNSK